MECTRREMMMVTAGASVSLMAGWRPVLGQDEGAVQLERPIPSSGEKIPCMGLGTSRTFNAGPDEQEREPLKEVLRLFHELGGRLLDTAPSYGKAEIVSGDLARDLQIGDDLFWATKVRTSGRDEGVKEMETSVERLHVDQIDLMQVHNLVDVETQLATLREWKEAGRIRYLGITTSSERQYEQFEQVMKRETLDFVQINYSLSQRRAAERLLPLAKDRGMAVMINRPYARGRLFQTVGDRPLPEWAAEFDCESWGQFFLKYILGHDAVTVLIPATSKAKHLRDNMDAGLGRVPDEAMRSRMEALFDAL